MRTLMTNRTPIFILLVVVALLFVVGTWQTIERWRDGSEAATEDSSVNSEGLLPGEEPGKVFGEEGQLVAGFPSVPQYPGATLLSSYRKVDGTRAGYEAKWEIDEPIITVVPWFIEEFTEGGWDWTIIEAPETFENTEQEILVTGDFGNAIFHFDQEAPAGEEDENAEEEVATHVVVEIPLQEVSESY